MKNISICGKDRVGKTTVAKKISKLHGSHIISFAEPLRSELRKYYGLTKEDLLDKDKKIIVAQNDIHKNVVKWFIEHNIVESAYYFSTFETTIRQLYNIHGTLIRRAQDKSYWVKKTKEIIDKLNDKDTFFVFDDIRFENEFNIAKEISTEFYFAFNSPDNVLENPRNIAEETLLTFVKRNKEMFKFIEVGIPMDDWIYYVLKAMKVPV
jgi:adenylate kinase family enzyme